MPLKECMEKHTEKELLFWQEWKKRKWNLPERSDHYVMDNTAILLKILALLPGTPPQVDPNRLKIKFKFGKGSPESSTAHKRNLTAMVKSIWKSRVNYKDPSK